LVVVVVVVVGGGTDFFAGKHDGLVPSLPKFSRKPMFHEVL